MNEQNESASVNTSLLAINQQTFAQGRYETAYYCLIAALHHARDLDNPETLQTIERLANEQASLLENGGLNVDSPSPFRSMPRYAILYRSLAHQANVLISLAKRRHSPIP